MADSPNMEAKAVLNGAASNFYKTRGDVNWNSLRGSTRDVKRG